MNACVSSVGAGAPGGLDAIHRSACSSTGERSNSPDAPFAYAQRLQQYRDKREVPMRTAKVG
jgi:hypothetical protein